jgi:hypothetical protein
MRRVKIGKLFHFLQFLLQRTRHFFIRMKALNQIITAKINQYLMLLPKRLSLIIKTREYIIWRATLKNDT